MNPLLTVREVAALCKWSTRQVYKMVSSGRLPAPLKVGRSTRWRASDIEAWIKNGCQLPTDSKGAGK